MPGVRYLSVAQVLFIHDQLIELTGGRHGLRDIAGLEASVAAPLAGIVDRELYPTLIEKAAVLLRSLICNHPFVDGNKRTGMTVAGLFLEENGWEMNARPLDFEDFAVRVAKECPSVEEIAGWLHRNAHRTEREARTD